MRRHRERDTHRTATVSVTAGVLVTLAIVACTGSPARRPERSFTVTIDRARTYQQIEGFGASGSWSIDPIGEQWSLENRSRLARLLFSVDDGIGLSVWKFNAGATGIASSDAFYESPYAWRKADSFRPSLDTGYDWTAHAGQRWFFDAARDYGVDALHLIVYSPPGWMTKNGLTHPDADSGTTNLEPERLSDFVEYIADIAVFLETSHGVAIADIVPLNEPNWAWNDSIQEANRYAVDDIKAVVIALGAELDARGLDSRIVTPEAGEIMALLDDDSFRRYWFGVQRRYNAQNLELTTGGKYREYAKEILGDPELQPYVRNTISAHSYWSDYTRTADDRLVRLRQIVRENLDAYAPGATYLQTEYCILGDRGPGRDLTMKSAISVAEVIHHDLTILNAAEWSWWLAVSPHDYKDGLLYTDWERPGDAEEILTSQIFWTLGQYSRFIRPGFVRVHADVESDALLVSAFVDPDGHGSVIVVINRADAPATIAVPRDSAYSAYRTSWTESLDSVGTVAAGSALALPPESVTTLVSVPRAP